MTTINDTFRNPAGVAVPNVPVRATLVAASEVLTGGGAIIRETETTTASDGTWSLDLTPISSLAVSENAYYLITADGHRWEIDVPDSGTHALDDVQIEPGPLPSTGATTVALAAETAARAAGDTARPELGFWTGVAFQSLPNARVYVGGADPAADPALTDGCVWVRLAGAVAPFEIVDVQTRAGGEWAPLALPETALDILRFLVLAPGDDIPEGTPADTVVLVPGAVLAATRVDPVGSPTFTTGTITSAGVDVTTPAGGEARDQILFFCRAQANATDNWSHSEMEELAGIQSAADRLNAVLRYRVRSADSVPASFHFDKPTGLADGQRYNLTAQIFRTSAVSDAPSGTTGGSTTYGGHAVPDRDEALTVVAAMAELAGGQSSTPGTTPTDFTELLATESAGGESVSRTCIRAVYGRGAPGSVALPWVGTASGPAALGVTLRPDVVTAQPRPVALTWGQTGWTIAEMDAALAAGDLVYWAHRGGSASYSEMTMRAYTNAVFHGARVLEVSVHRSLDGVWIMCHDADLTAVTGGANTSVIASTNAAALLGVPVTSPIPGGVIGRIEDLLTAYPGWVILVDNKPQTNRAELYALVKSLVPDWADRIIWKIDGANNVALFTEAQAEGFKVAGYWFPSGFSTFFTQAKADETDYIGLSESAPSGDWDTATTAAGGKPLWGHILETEAHVTTVLAEGATILQCANIDLIPQVNTLP